MSLSRKTYWYIFLFFFILLNFIGWWRGRSADFWSLLSIFALITIVFTSALKFLLRRKIISLNLFQNLRLFLYTFIIALLIVEIGLRVFFTDLTNGSYSYVSSFDPCLETCDSCNGRYYFIHDPNTTYDNNKGEFHYKHSYNSLGLRDHEFTKQKAHNEFRIMGIGDSFVEGVGTSADSTWLKQLELLLNKDSGSIKYTTMNAGTQGSDLFFSYDMLKNCLLAYKPDLVILNLNSSDISDITYRGGDERFDEHGNFNPKRGPWWEFYFASSYIVRGILLRIFHYNWQLQSPSEQKTSYNIVLAEISDKLDSFQALAHKEHFAFLLILQPLQNELGHNDNFISKLKVNAAIPKIDLTDTFSNEIKANKGKTDLFYWPIDGHFTSRGYALEATTIYKNYFKTQYFDSINILTHQNSSLSH